LINFDKIYTFVSVYEYETDWKVLTSRFWGFHY